MVAVLIPLLAVAVSGTSLGGPDLFALTLVLPLALNLIAAGVLCLRYSILRLWLLIVMGVAVSLLVTCAYYLYVMVVFLRGWWWPTHPVAVWGAYVMLAIVGVLALALAAHLLADRRRRRLEVAA